MEKGMLDGLKANYTQDLLLDSSCGCRQFLLYYNVNDIHIVGEGFKRISFECAASNKQDCKDSLYFPHHSDAPL